MKFDLKQVDSLTEDIGTCVGVDEVGRGPIAGPVVACAVSCNIKNHKDLLQILSVEGICDSKKLSQLQRQKILSSLGIETFGLELNVLYKFKSFRFILSAATHKEVDSLNIHHATLKAMAMTIEQMRPRPRKSAIAAILIDGKWVPKDEHFLGHKVPRNIQMLPVIKGDQKSLLIGLASIIAKEYRDSLMKKYDNSYPGYGLAKHSGYPTAFHRKAVKELGPCKIHRKTFKGVKELLQQ